MVYILKVRSQIVLGNNDEIFLKYLLEGLGYPAYLVVPNRQFYLNGELYTGDVEIRSTTIPSDGSQPVPGDFTGIDSQNNEVLLASRGFFAIEFIDTAGNILTPVGKIIIKVPLGTFDPGMRLWGLDPVTGVWMDLGEFEERNGFLIVIICYWRLWVWFNIDIVVIPRNECWLKVRTFKDCSSFAEMNQVGMAQVSLSSTTDSGFLVERDGLTDAGDGVCIKTVCDDRIIYNSVLTGTRDGQDLLGVSGDDSSIPANIRNLINYNVNGQTTVEFINRLTSPTDGGPGPFYSDELSCREAAFGEPHIRLYKPNCTLDCPPPTEPNDECTECVCSLTEYNIWVISKDGASIVDALITEFPEDDVMTDDPEIMEMSGLPVNSTIIYGMVILCRPADYNATITVSKPGYINTTVPLERSTLVTLDCGKIIVLAFFINITMSW